jgi:hypothetical protein
MEFARYGLVVPLLELMRRMGVISVRQAQDIEAMDLGKMVREPGWRGQAIPGYRLIARIASGGFAVIWTAEALFGTGRVAVKMLHPERSKDPRSVAARVRPCWGSPLPEPAHRPRIGQASNAHPFHDHGVRRRQPAGQALSEVGAFRSVTRSGIIL